MILQVLIAFGMDLYWVMSPILHLQTFLSDLGVLCLVYGNRLFWIVHTKTDKSFPVEHNQHKTSPTNDEHWLPGWIRTYCMHSKIYDVDEKLLMFCCGIVDTCLSFRYETFARNLLLAPSWTAIFNLHFQFFHIRIKK